MKLFLLLLGLLLWVPSYAATQYWRPACSINGNGSSPNCVPQGGSPGDVGAFNTPSSLTLSITNDAYLIGLATSNWNPGGIVGSFNGSYWQLRCDHPLGQGGFSTSSGSQIGFGGGSRNGLKVGPKCSFGGGAANGISIGASGAGITNAGVYIFDSDFVGLTSSGIAIEPVQDGINTDIEIVGNNFSLIGANMGEFSRDPGAWVANTVYTLGVYRRPTTANAYVYKATTAGTSGSSEPSWPITIGATVADGSVVWTTTTPLGEGVRIAPARNASGSASGLVQGVRIYNNSFTGTPQGGRYGVNAYPCTTCTLVERATSGRVKDLRIYDNRFYGEYLFPAINLSNDVDDSFIYSNSFFGQAGGAVIHTGGQGTYGTCNASTDNIVIRDHRTGSGTLVSGAVVNVFNPSDGAGILPDECSTNIRVFRNEIAFNPVAGLYLNDADNVTAIGNVIYGNGDNAVHVHGLGINFIAYHNSTYHTASSPSGRADQGVDGWQIDATTGSGTTLINNEISCGPNVPKCVDADTTITESYNGIFHPDALKAVEGFTPVGTDVLVDPKLLGGSAPSKAGDFCLRYDSPLLNAGTPLGVWVKGFDMEDLGSTPSIGARGRCALRPYTQRVLSW